MTPARSSTTRSYTLEFSRSTRAGERPVPKAPKGFFGIDPQSGLTDRDAREGPAYNSIDCGTSTTSTDYMESTDAYAVVPGERYVVAGLLKSNDRAIISYVDDRNNDGTFSDAGDMQYQLGVLQPANQYANTLAPFWATFEISAIATVLCILLGYPLALALQHAGNDAEQVRHGKALADGCNGRDHRDDRCQRGASRQPGPLRHVTTLQRIEGPGGCTCPRQSEGFVALGVAAAVR